MSKHTKKKNSIDWMNLLVSTVSGVVSGVLSGLIVWYITK